MWREPPSRTLARTLLEAGFRPPYIRVWLSAPCVALGGNSPLAVMERAARLGRVDDGWRRLIDTAASYRERPCGLLDPLDEDGTCPCGERHLG